jgi:hypothetical protein
VDVELHQAFVSHFQKEGLASFLIHDIGAFHDFVNFERLLAERAQDIFSIIQQDEIPPAITRQSVRIRKLIFRNHPLDILRFALDAVSETSVCLNGHTLNDGVDHWWIGCCTTLWPLIPVVNVLIQLIGMCHVSTSKINGCSSADRAVKQCPLGHFGFAGRAFRDFARHRDEKGACCSNGKKTHSFD